MKELIFKKVKEILSDPNKVFSHKIYIHKRNEYYGLTIYGEDNETLVAIDSRVYEKFVTEPTDNFEVGKSKKVRELNVLVNHLGNVTIDLSEDEVIEFIYLYNNLYKIFETKLVEEIKI